MVHTHRVGLAFVVGAITLAGSRAAAQGGQAGAAAAAPTIPAATVSQVTNGVAAGLPNPYTTVGGWAKLPAGRTWGSTSAVEIDKDGKTIWVAERCGVNTCGDSLTVDPILHFDETGRLLSSFGKGLIVSPHGISVDAEGNIWVTDFQARNGISLAAAGRGGAAGAAGAAAPAAGAAGRGGAAAPAAGAPAAGAPAAGRAGGAAAPAGPPKGMQVFKFSPTGQLLMTIGKPGGDTIPKCCFEPNDVLVAPDGSIFVTQGHGQLVDHIFKFSKDGQTILTHWGTRGTGPGQFSQPHGLAMDSRGRLFVADRANNRIQIFDQSGKFLDMWYQFSRLSGIYIDKKDILYGTDSESGGIDASRKWVWNRGIRIGSAKDGTMYAFIPDWEQDHGGTWRAEGVAADAAGNIYGAEVGPRALLRYEPIRK